MTIFRRYSSPGFLGAVLALGVDCQALCVQDRQYTGDEGSCAGQEDKLHVSCADPRIELGTTATISLQIGIERSMNVSQLPLYPGVTPTVELSVDGRPPGSAAVTVSADGTTLAVMTLTAQQTVGELKATVTMPSGLATAVSGCRVYRAPKFAATGLPVPFVQNPRGNFQPKGAAAQVGNVFGQSVEVLITEQFTNTGNNMEQRWLELYRFAAAPAGPLVRDGTSPGWATKQPLLLESKSALLAVTSGALVVYDDRTMSPPVTKDITKVVPLASPTPDVYKNISDQGVAIPPDATSLAAATDDDLILLGRPGQVQWLRVNPKAGVQNVTPLGMTPVSGMPVIAARGALGSVPMQRLARYFGVAWNSAGLATLLQSDTGIPAGSTLLTPIPLSATAQNEFQALLGTEQVAAAALADLDSDGLQDLLVATTGTGRLLWAAQLPDGTFVKPTALPISQSQATGLSVGDLDGDERPDLVVTTSDQRVVVFLGTP